MGLIPYYSSQIPNPSSYPTNALVGMAGPKRLMVNQLQAPAPQQPPQQHPMMYQPFGVPAGGTWGQQRIPNPVQWPNPHQGAYAQWMQQFNPQRSGPQRY